ncbi:hypothetical protein BCR44DRAFT_1425925 [Catenaria anguillulae PL171]|uniref:Uncharacterized protein n=1 Tax=Catenaria anguillulae PL171 TaxID=765915 RepID=A0A1Y2HZB5_9FUNG|nr:hypothetical protein BCR44DRAFT_1425925 [Catenaria anguillulae PL171]
MLGDFARARRAAVLPDLAKVIVALERKHLMSRFTQTQTQAVLPITKQWLAAAMESAIGPVTRGAIYRHVFDTAMIQLVLNPPDHHDVPETLHLDAARVTYLSEHVHRLLLAATLMTHAKSRSPTDIGSGPLVALVHAGHTRDATDLVLAQVREARSRKHLVDLLVTQATGLGMSRIVAKCVCKADPVYKVLARRVEADLRAGLMMAEDKGGKPNVSVCKALDMVGHRMSKVLGKVVAMARLNRVVYAEWYDRALDEVVSESETRRQTETEE